MLHDDWHILIAVTTGAVPSTSTNCEDVSAIDKHSTRQIGAWLSTEALHIAELSSFWGSIPQLAGDDGYHPWLPLDVRRPRPRRLYALAFTVERC